MIVTSRCRKGSVRRNERLLQGCLGVSLHIHFIASYRSGNPGHRKQRRCHGRYLCCVLSLSPFLSIARGRQRLIISRRVLAIYKSSTSSSSSGNQLKKAHDSQQTRLQQFRHIAIAVITKPSRCRIQSKAATDKIYGETHRYSPPTRPPFNIYPVIDVVFFPSSDISTNEDRICLNHAQQTTARRIESRSTSFTDPSTYI